MNFGMMNFIVSNYSKKTSVFECYILIDPMEWGIVIFWGWCITMQLLDPMIISLIFLLIFLRRMVIPNMSKIA
jgi:hypothetical protein